MDNFELTVVGIKVTGNSATSSAERRRHPRQRVLKSAAIVFGGSNYSIACQILDVSESGALLMPLDVISCPASSC